MSETGLPIELQTQAAEAGLEVLRATVVAAGGLDGVFREFREDSRAAFDRYGLLLRTSTTPAQRTATIEANRRREQTSTLEERIAAVASINDIPYQDAVYLYIAQGIVDKAGIAKEE